MTTGNAPTIDDQIAYAQQLVNDGKYPEYAKAILASLEKLAALESLEKLAALESQPVPVEPFRRFRGVLKPVDRGMWVNGPCDYYHDAEVDTRIDSLQSALQRAQEKYEQAVSNKQIAEAQCAELLQRAEKAEALNRRMVEQYRDLVVAAENHRCYKAQCGICVALEKLNRRE